jgi:hypothetical protein
MRLHVARNREQQNGYKLLVGKRFLLFARHNWNNEVEEDEMGGVCSTDESSRTDISYWWESQRDGDH